MATDQTLRQRAEQLFAQIVAHDNAECQCGSLQNCDVVRLQELEAALIAVQAEERQRCAAIARSHGDSRDNGWIVAVKIAEAIEG